MTSLVIVESPTKARTLTRFLGKEYRIEATMGHIRDLPEKRLGIKIEEKLGKGKTDKQYDFLLDYQIIQGKRQKVTELKKMAAESTSVILATDPDREGEAIAFHIKELLTQRKKSKTKEMNFSRIVFHEITQSALKEAISSPREIDMMLVDAQQARRVLDRLVGYKLSPLLWNKLGKRWLSAGRVQTVAVRLIVEREREIQAFKPEEYWLIDVLLEKLIDKIADSSDKGKLLTRLVEINGVKADLKNKVVAEKAVEDLKTSAYQVGNIDEKEVRRYSPPPFITSSLQQTASNRFGWSAKKTMRTAQILYEEGYISYHRTDSTNISKEAIEMAREFVNDVYGQSYLPASPKIYKTKSKVAQEAHEAIRPTNIKVISEKDYDRIDGGKRTNLKVFDSNLGREAQLLYSLIWRRFLACQMNEAIFDQISILILAQQEKGGNKYSLKVTGTTMKFAGWMRLYEDLGNNHSDKEAGAEENKELPVVSLGEKLRFADIFPQQKFTEPPARYTEASLIKILEEKGIGRPSTYAPIISTIQDRKYVEKIEKKFHPTDLGIEVVDFLVKYFPVIFDISFTAKMEDDLDEIANGSHVWVSIISDFYAPFKHKLDKVFKEADRVMMDLGTTDEKCQKCGSPMVIRLSKYGKFLACSTYPECKFTKNIIEPAGIKCPQCGNDIVVKRTRRGKQFYGCSNYPKCQFAAWKKEDIK